MFQISKDVKIPILNLKRNVKIGNINYKGNQFLKVSSFNKKNFAGYFFRKNIILIVIEFLFTIIKKNIV